MSGGYFDYVQYRFEDVAEEIERHIHSLPGCYPPEVLERFRLAAVHIRTAGKMLQRVDWLLSDDDGPESFLRRWSEDGLE